MTRVFLALIVALLCISPVALANDEDGDESGHERGEMEERHDNDKDDDHKEAGRGAHGHDADKVKRKAQVDVSGQQARIKLERENGSVEDEIKVHYVANAGTLKVSYSTENASTESKTELKVRVKEVVEFRDTDGDGGFARNDTVVARHSIGSLDWRIVGPEPITAAGLQGQRITGIGEFSEGGALVLVMYVYGDFATMNGTSLAPTDVKIDIILDQFPFQANDTLVAVVVKSEQESKIEVEGDEGDDEMVASANGFAAYFEWADNATVDGVSKPVVTTLLKADSNEDEKTEKTFSLAYARGAFINHDPVLGVQSTATDAHDTPGVGVFGVVAGVLVAVAVASRRR